MGILINNQFRLAAGWQLALALRVSSERVCSRNRFLPSAVQFIHPETRRHPVASLFSHHCFPRSAMVSGHFRKIINHC